MSDDDERKESKEKQEEQKVPSRDGREGPIDPYTGEVEPPAEDAYKVVEVIPTDPDNRKGENFLMDDEDSLDKLVLDTEANADAMREEIDHFTDDEDVLDDFAERQGLAVGGRQKLEEKLNDYNFMDPTLSGGDIDAAWEDSDVAGEESVGGSAPTPDQDVVDEIGQAAGLNYRDDEPLDSDKKILDRDRNRWELNPQSADDEEEDDEDVDVE
jgi:hypothetical protein